MLEAEEGCFRLQIKHFFRQLDVCSRAYFWESFFSRFSWNFPEISRIFKKISIKSGTFFSKPGPGAQCMHTCCMNSFEKPRYQSENFYGKTACTPFLLNYFRHFNVDAVVWKIIFITLMIHYKLFLAKGYDNRSGWLSPMPVSPWPDKMQQSIKY